MIPDRWTIRFNARLRSYRDFALGGQQADHPCCKLLVSSPDSHGAKELLTRIKPLKSADVMEVEEAKLLLPIIVC